MDTDSPSKSRPDPKDGAQDADERFLADMSDRLQRLRSLMGKSVRKKATSKGGSRAA